jgi:ribosomal subunit interface protein
VDIVVKGRQLELSDRFRALVEDKLGKVERFDPTMQRVDVEVSKETNPRLSDRAYRVELTCRGRGPVIRGEAAAGDKLAALDLAWGRLEARLRKAADRRTDRKKHTKAGPTPVSVAVAPDGVPGGLVPGGSAELTDQARAGRSDGSADGRPLDRRVEPAGERAGDGAVADADRWSASDDGPMVVRRKSHVAAPMNLDRALYEMELVGHDFFLFVDEDSGCPSVVYRRRAYDYGVIELRLAGEQTAHETAEEAAGATGP